jgi:hypothetical protein
LYRYDAMYSVVMNELSAYSYLYCSTVQYRKVF